MAPIAAPAATETFTASSVGLSTQTLFTAMSLDPNPTVTCPLTKCVATPLMVSSPELPAESAGSGPTNTVGVPEAGRL